MRSVVSFVKCQMMSLLFRVALCCGVVAGTGSAARAQLPDQERVQAAVSKFQQVIHGAQLPGGAWKNEDNTLVGGDEYLTSYSVYALLVSGVSAEHPTIKKAVAGMRIARMEFTEDVSFRAAVWILLGREYEKELKLCVDWLLQACDPNGAWSLRSRGTGPRVEGESALPNLWATRQAVWALYHASNAGVEVREDVWKRIHLNIVKRPLKGDVGVDVAQWQLIHALSQHKSGAKAGSYKNAGAYSIAMHEAAVREGIHLRSRAIPWEIFEQHAAMDGNRYSGKHDYDLLFSDIYANPTAISVISAFDIRYGLVQMARRLAPRTIVKLYVVNPATRVADLNDLDAMAILNWKLQSSHVGPLIWEQMDIMSPYDAWSHYGVAVLAGEKPMVFTPEFKANLKKFSAGGGLIVICGSKPFRINAEKLATELFAGKKLEPLAANHPLLTVNTRVDLAPALIGKTRVIAEGTRVQFVLPAVDWEEVLLKDEPKDPDIHVATSLVRWHMSESRKGPSLRWRTDAR